MAVTPKTTTETKKPRAKPRRRWRTVLEDGPREIDVYVGQRVRQRRVLCGLSQTELATAIGLTFQQLQKYERGMNRISASKLWQISQVLDVPVQWFFKEFAEPKDEEDKRKESFHMKRETLELVRNYVAAPADVQRKFLGLVKSIANSASS
ncbi:MAG: helix-turn-helix domain-containing protein [Alphaproteobacteria bacterium]